MLDCMFPMALLDPLYSTRVLLDRYQDCGNSSLLPLDSRRDSLHHLVQLTLVHEVCWMPTLDTFFHSQSCSKFPCTHARVESFYNLDKVNIHRVNIQKLHLLLTTALREPVLSKVDDLATFKKVEVHAKNSTF